MEAEGDAYVLSVHLPFLTEDEVTAEQFGDELVVQVRNQRRSYGLPNFLSYYRLAKAALEDDWLRARFEPNPA
jgi:arsenite-transporting ATPase